MIWTLLLACAGSRVAPTPSPPAPPKAPLAVHMDEHLVRATAIRDAVVLGRFPEAREGFRWLASHEAAEGSAVWSDELRAVAKEGAVATRLADQAAALGRVANACGGCHESLQDGPRLPELAAPPDDSTLPSHMARHAWANDRMWAALVEPSARAWERSLQVLAPAPDPAPDTAPWGLTRDVTGMDVAVHQLAHAALEDDNPDTRADLYGQIVSQCAGCHLVAREDQQP